MTSEDMLQVEHLTVEIAGMRLLDDVSLTLNNQERLMVVGPNGSGKSTLISAISQGIPYRGKVSMDGKNASRISSAELARRVGVFSQHNEVNYGFTVEEIVKLGRYAYAKGLFSGGDQEAGEKVEMALEMTGLTGQRYQSVLTLSGGELQRVFLAQLFAQDPRILLLDEPTNHLDIQYQKQLFALIDQWAEKKERAVMAVVHDLSLARLYGTRILLLNQGKIVACGSKDEVLSRENLSLVYNMDVVEWMQILHDQWIQI